MVKAFLSGATDRFRAPYGRLPETIPRSVVFCGTINHGNSECTKRRATRASRSVWPRSSKSSATRGNASGKGGPAPTSTFRLRAALSPLSPLRSKRLFLEVERRAFP
jgi:hypothetical protein